MVLKFIIASSVTLTMFLSPVSISMDTAVASTNNTNASPIVKLPTPNYEGKKLFETVLKARRSIRNYSDGPLTLAEVSQLLWAAQGITGTEGKRSAPSAGALYPLEVYLVVGRVDHLETGIYKYLPYKHRLERISKDKIQKKLCAAALNQTCIEDAAINIVITALYESTTFKYGVRGIRYVHMEAGSVAQNIYLQAVALKLGVVLIGAFDDGQVKKIMNLQNQEQPLGIMPVGRLLKHTP